MRCLIALALAFTLVLPDPVSAAEPAEESTAVQPDISAVEDEIAKAARELDTYQGGTIKALVQLRLETLRLTKALLEQHALAVATGAQFVYSATAAKPDMQKADEILQEIVETTAELDRLRSEAAKYSGGLVQAMALVAVQTQENNLALLRHGYYVSRYGIVLPSTETSTTIDDESTTNVGGAADTDRLTENEIKTPQWADANYPDIDYSVPFYEVSHANGSQIFGRWVINTDEAEIDGSLRVVAMNVENPQDMGSFRTPPTMLLGCREGETILLFNFDEYLLSDDDVVLIDYRKDDEIPQQTRWGVTTDSKMTGLWGRSAIDFAKDLLPVHKLYVRATERDGSRVDGLWDIRGIDRAAELVADACGWAVLELSAADLRTIQEMLAAAGYYRGDADGKMGPKTRAALQAYQQAQGLQVTGTLDTATLNSLGWSR